MRQVFCLGKSEYGEGSSSHFAIRGDAAAAVAAGDTHSMVVTAQGRLFAFGRNEWGQLGLGHKTKTSKPTHVQAFDGARVKLVSCGRYHTVVVTEGEKVFACGSNTEGQLGVKVTGESSAVFVHVASLPPGPFRALSCGADHTIIIAEDGGVYAWGAGAVGQLGNGMKPQPVPKPVKFKTKRRMALVACGYYHTLCVSEGDEIFSFGEGEYGKLGLNDDKEASVGTPTKVGGIDGHVLAIAYRRSQDAVVWARAAWPPGAADRGRRL